jgi:hypothetical protein
MMSEVTVNSLSEAPPGLDDEITRDPAARMVSVSTSLRALGAVLVIAATSTFMVQQWDEGGEVVRYLTLLTFTALLTGSGLVCGLGIRESRGARTFLALVIASVPIHFAVLGGLLQSQFPLDATLTGNAPWNVDSPLTAVWLTGLGVMTLIPLTWLSMLTLVRPHARRLTLTFIAVNLALLLPVRDPGAVAWVVALMAVLAFAVERRTSRMGHAVSTGEGKFVRIVMLAPIAIIVGRTVLWYDPDMLFVGLTLLTGAVLCFEWVPKVRGGGLDARAVQLVCAVAAVAGWVLLSLAHIDLYRFPDQLLLLLLALPASALLMVLSTRCIGVGAGYRLAATFLAVGASLVNLMMSWDPTRFSAAGFACLAVGVAFVAYGIYGRRLAPLALGSIAAACGISQALVAAIEIENFFHWGSLAFSGAILIFAAAICERYAKRLIAIASTAHDQILGWEY